MQERSQDMVGFIWTIANKLRGPYRPPQYRKVMLPLVVLRRLDCVLEPKKLALLNEKERLEVKGITGPALEKALSKVAVGQDRSQPLYNTSPFTFQKLLGDAPNIASNLVSYINGFSPRARDIFEKFEFENEIQKLDENNRLFLIIKEFSAINLSPSVISNMDMGYLFEELVRKFNEQANEEAGDHFTPREVIRLMVNVLFSEEKDVFKQGIYKSVYDPTAGTGGMLSVSEEHIKALNPSANIELFGQEYNPEAFAICCSDLLIKDEPIDNLVYGDTLGLKEAKNKGNNFVPHDGHQGKQFHYMLANPPFGVEWKPEADFVEDEHKRQSFNGRFGAGLPRINDGSLLFLQHMISKMHRAPNLGGDGSKIAIVFNGSPLFTGDAGSGESNIRRWIIENDWLDAVIALPDQMFYNTGISTYIWLVTNKKPEHRTGKVQLIDGTRHYQKMRKSLGNKRNELSEQQIADLVRLYGEYTDGGESLVRDDEKSEFKSRICSKLFENTEFGYLKVTVERPLRLNFQASPERIERMWKQTSFVNLASSKKRKDDVAQKSDVAAGEKEQNAVIKVLQTLNSQKLYQSRPKFDVDLEKAFSSAKLKLSPTLRKAIYSALSERDPEAEICLDSSGRTESDTELRDFESVPFPTDIELPLPLGYDNETGHDALLKRVREHCEAYLKTVVHPFAKDAWIDHTKTKVGYEIALNRHFYSYQAPRPLQQIEADIKTLETEIVSFLAEVV